MKPRREDEGEAVSKYVVLAFLGMVDGQANEAHKEVADLDEALAAIREVVGVRGRDWHAISLIHVEDYPGALQGAVLQERQVPLPE